MFLRSIHTFTNSKILIYIYYTIVYIPQFPYPFFCQRTLRLFQRQLLKLCCKEHRGTHIFWIIFIFFRYSEVELLYQMMAVIFSIFQNFLFCIGVQPTNKQYCGSSRWIAKSLSYIIFIIHSPPDIPLPPNPGCHITLSRVPWIIQ